MADFRLSCYRLFREHALTRYCTEVSEGHYDLRVLLIGSGTRFDTLFQEILVNGQLLDTDLYITVLTPNAARNANSLLSKAPGLKEYVGVECNGSELNVPETDNVYAHVCYRSVGKDEVVLAQQISEAKASGCKYVVISTGKDAVNLEYAQIAAPIFESEDLISFIRNKKPAEAVESKAEVFAFGFQKDTAYLEQLETIAYNLHYAYSKAANERAANSQIRKSFEEPYNYMSNMAAALHIEEKLDCCGIDTSDNETAAEGFAALMKEDPSVIRRLAALEHRRWMVEKMLKGFVQASSLDLIYSGRGVTTHDSEKKWHTCLVPCDEISELTADDWKKPDKINPELDSLDRMSLEIHVKCGQIANNNRELIDETFPVIRKSAERIFKDKESILSSMRSMELAVSQMWQGKRNALSIYERNFQTLLDEAASENNASAFNLQQSLSALNTAIAPLKEYISFKDYKEQDRLLIRQISFALTHKMNMVLVKLLAGTEADTLFSTCQLEPDCSVFVDIVASHEDYLKLKEHISHIGSFLSQSYPDVAREYHVLLLDKLAEEHREKLAAIDPDSVKVHLIGDIGYETISEALSYIVSKAGADYIDVKGGNPVLTVCASSAGIPIIAHSSGSMINILNAPEVTYPSPGKSITVKEMFDMSGAVLVEQSDSSVLSDLSKSYKKLFNIANNASSWDYFCTHVSGFYKKHTRKELEMPVLKTTNETVSKSITLNTETASALKPVFDRLSEKGYIENVTETSKLTNQRSISFNIKGDEAGDEVLGVIHKCAGVYTPDISYKVNFNGMKPTITYANLWIENMGLPADKRKEYRHLLNGLASNGLLIDFAIKNPKSDNPLFSFRFASKDILSAIQSSGKVLEYYIYYSALLDAHFDDVEMGWHFQHTASDDSADNELDVICTRGISSLFISAKSGEQTQIRDDSAHLKYVIYEISLLADRFGMNARPVLAVPAIPQFQTNEQTGEQEFNKQVKAAYRRGVYLLGTECFRGDVLGEVLDRIADGREDWCDFLKS